MVCPPATSEAGIMSAKVVSCSNINGYPRKYQNCSTLVITGLLSSADMADDLPAYAQFLRTLLLLPLNAEKLTNISCAPRKLSWSMLRVTGSNICNIWRQIKTDISASSTGHWGHTRSCLKFLKRDCRYEFKMVRHDLVVKSFLLTHFTKKLKNSRPLL
jgi:hypothetical protein